MNWMGGARSRIKQKDEKKKQQEFFSRMRLAKQLNENHPEIPFFTPGSVYFQTKMNPSTLQNTTADPLSCASNGKPLFTHQDTQNLFLGPNPRTNNNLSVNGMKTSEFPNRKDTLNRANKVTNNNSSSTSNYRQAIPEVHHVPNAKFSKSKSSTSLDKWCQELKTNKLSGIFLDQSKTSNTMSVLNGIVNDVSEDFQFGPIKDNNKLQEEIDDSFCFKPRDIRGEPRKSPQFVLKPKSSHPKSLFNFSSPKSVVYEPFTHNASQTSTLNVQETEPFSINEFTRTGSSLSDSSKTSIYYTTETEESEDSDYSISVLEEKVSSKDEIVFEKRNNESEYPFLTPSSSCSSKYARKPKKNSDESIFSTPMALSKKQDHNSCSTPLFVQQSQHNTKSPYTPISIRALQQPTPNNNNILKATPKRNITKSQYPVPSSETLRSNLYQNWMQKEIYQQLSYIHPENQPRPPKRSQKTKNVLGVLKVEGSNCNPYHHANVGEPCQTTVMQEVAVQTVDAFVDIEKYKTKVMHIGVQTDDTFVDREICKTKVMHIGVQTDDTFDRETCKTPELQNIAVQTSQFIDHQLLNREVYRNYNYHRFLPHSI